MYVCKNKKPTTCTKQCEFGWECEFNLQPARISVSWSVRVGKSPQTYN